MKREQKEQLVSEVSKALNGAASIVVLQQSGLKAGDTATSRRKVNENNVTLKVLKNTLARLALKGTQYEYLIPLFKGPTAVAYSADPVSAAKVIAGLANDNDKIQIVGGGMGDKNLSKADVIALSKLPSLNELRGKIVGLLQAPATKVACVLQAPAGQLARVFSAYGSKN